LSSFNKMLNIAIMISYLARSSIKEFHISSLLIQTQQQA
jgi:hypothetical protein